MPRMVVGPTQGDPERLGAWIETQRRAYKKPETEPSRPSADRIKLLGRLPGWAWEGKRGRCAADVPSED